MSAENHRLVRSDADPSRAAACDTQRADGTTDPQAVIQYNQSVPPENQFGSKSSSGELGSTAVCAACQFRYSTLLGAPQGCQRLTETTEISEMPPMTSPGLPTQRHPSD